MGKLISVQAMLEVVASFDAHGGASPGLIAWELFADEHDILTAWELALAEGWLTPAGRDLAYDEQLYRLTLSGWVAARERSPGLESEPGAAKESVHGLPSRVPMIAYEHNRRPPHRRANSAWAGRLSRRPAAGLGAGATGLTNWFAGRQRPLAVGFELHDAPQLPQAREVLVSVKRRGHPREIAD